MEAVVFDGATFEVKYEDKYPIPRVEKDDDVIVRVEYSGVCGSDLHVLKGEFPVAKTRHPMGHEFSGHVYDAGKACSFKKGQKVVVDPNGPCRLCNFCRCGSYQYCLDSINNSIGMCTDGGWARYVRVPLEKVYAIPEGISTEQAALVEPYSCVLHGYDRASPLDIGSKILIVGAGIIGNLWICLLHHAGHRDVTVSEMSKGRLEIVKRINTGFRLVTPDVLEKEKGQVLYDVIIDATGIGKVMEINFNYLRQGGKYVLFGCCPATHTSTLNPFQIYDKELTLIGVKINKFTFPRAISLITAMGERYSTYENLGVKKFSLSDYEKAFNELKSGSISKAMFEIK